jgi:hypothetical protein
MSPTGKRECADVLFKGHLVICLDHWQRLPFNFAVNAGGSYREFATLAQAKRYIRSL